MSALQWTMAFLVCVASWKWPLAPVAAYVIAVYVPGMILGNQLLPVPWWLLVLPVAAAIACFSHASVGQLSRLNWTVLTLLGLMSVSVGYTYLLSQQWRAYAQFICLGLAFNCAFVIQSRGRFIGGLAILAIYSVGVSYAYLRMGTQVTGGGVLGTDSAVNLLVADRNYRAFECVPGVLIGLGLLLAKEDRGKGAFIGLKVIGLFLVCFCGFAFLQTQSRGGIIALASSFLCLTVHRARTAWTGIALVTVLVVVLGLTQVPGLLQGVGTRFQQEDVTTLSSRLDIWRDALVAFQNRNFLDQLLGCGIGAAEVEVGASTHNGCLRILMDQGLGGLALGGALMICALCRSWKRRDSVGTMQFSLSSFAVVASLDVEPHYFIPAFGIVLGLGVAMVPTPAAWREAPRMAPRGLPLPPPGLPTIRSAN